MRGLHVRGRLECKVAALADLDVLEGVADFHLELQPLPDEGIQATDAGPAPREEDPVDLLVRGRGAEEVERALLERLETLADADGRLPTEADIAEMFSVSPFRT